MAVIVARPSGSLPAPLVGIEAIVNALAVLEETGGTITSVLGSEVTVYRNNAPGGVFIPKCVKIATANHTATESITVREYYRIESGGGLILHDSKPYVGAIAMEEITVRLDPNRFGVEITLELDAGTPRDYTWEALYKV